MIFRTLLRINPEYQAALIWMAECQKELITVDDVSEQWYQRLDATNDRNHGRQNLDCLRDSAVTFFHLCQAADLGSMTLGKRGRTTRLFIDRDELVKFVSQYFKESDRDIDETFESDSTVDDPWPLTALENEFFVTEKVRDVLLIDNGNQVVTDQIKAAFELAGLSHLMIVEDKEQGRIRFDRKSYRAFNSTSLGCLVIGENEAERDPKTLQWRLKDTVLYEIGAAAFGLRSRLILVSTVKLKMPKVLNEIPLFQLQSGHLSWEIALQIVDKIKSIKKLEGES